MANDKRTVATIDKRPFFERALCFGVKHGLIDDARTRTIITDGAKGTVQVADHFGTSHLHADLDNARKRIVHLISLYLEDVSGGDLTRAAESLRDNGFLLHSRSGNEMLKKLHALPESTVIGDSKGQTLKEFQSERTLAKSFSLTAFKKERRRRQDNAAVIATAFWFADQMKVARSSLEFVSAETVIRTAILLRLDKGTSCPSRSEFARLVDTIRAKAQVRGTLAIPKSLLKDIPDIYQSIANDIRREMEKHDVPLLLNAEVDLGVLFNTFESRYFLRDSGLEDVDRFDAFVSKEWHKVTKGKEDPYSRMTIFMCLATGIKPKPAISETEAKSMVRRVRKEGFDSDAVATFIRDAAPFELKENLLSWWQEEFLPEAKEMLSDESDTKYDRGVRFLKEHCMVNVKGKSGEK